jgi:pimeloyl-ACP methyl ester carboxylesterase
VTLLPSLARAQNKPEEITFDTFDGVKLQGDWYPSDKTTKAPTALLLHKIGGDHKQMAPVAEALQAAGFAVLSFDFRGHGGSTTVTPTDFWKNPKNQAGILGWKPMQNSIDVKNFRPNYYSYLVNDIASAKYFLEKKNNARECNANDLVVVGAEDGGSLAAIWLYTEWDRRRVSPDPTRPGTMKQGEPEGKDIAAAVFLSLRPTLGNGKQPLQASQALHSAFQGAAIKDPTAKASLQAKVGYCFIYGNEDTASANLSADIYNNVLKADANKLKLTYRPARQGRP